MTIVDGVEMVDVREAAALVGRTPETVRRWVWSGRLAARRHGNRLLIARQDLLAARAGAPAAPTLREWEARLPTGGGRARASAADLVLEDRAARDARR